jgi:hypothetical protein
MFNSGFTSKTDVPPQLPQLNPNAFKSKVPLRAGFDGNAPIQEDLYMDANPQAFQSQPSDPVSTSPFVGMPGFDGNAPLPEPQAPEYKKPGVGT